MLRDLAYGLYSRKLRRGLSGATLPRHVGLIMDGNRRWARQTGLARPQATWQVHTAGTLDVLPASTARALKAAVEATRECATGAHVTLAVGYGGRQEVIDAIRALLYEQAEGGGTLTGLAEILTTDDIARHLYTAGQPDPDLIIRTSGEQRLSGFLPWQSAHSELYFCDAYWPAFREIDFLRALRSFAARQNRRGA